MTNLEGWTSNPTMIGITGTEVYLSPLAVSASSFRLQHTEGRRTTAAEGAVMLLAVVFVNYSTCSFLVDDVVGAAGKNTSVGSACESAHKDGPGQPPPS